MSYLNDINKNIKKTNSDMKKMMNKVNRKFFLDSDRDGSPNLLDCEPYNPFKQDRQLNRQREEEIKKLPIYFASSSDPLTDMMYPKSNKQKLYHYSEKKMPKGAYKAKKRFQASAKKRPEMIGEIKRKKPAVVVYTTGGVEQEGYGIAAPSKKQPHGQHVVVVRATSRQGQRYGQQGKHETADTTVHELEHVRQFRSYEKKPKLKKRMTKGKYEKRREEVLAREAEAKARRKHSRITYGTRKKGLKGMLDLVFGEE